MVNHRHYSPGPSAVVLTFLAFLAILLVLPQVHGHANLIASDPPQNTVLANSPRQLTLVFTETLEPEFSELSLYDSTGVRIETGDVHIDPQDPKIMRTDLPQLGSGVYTVQWKVVSAVDGHSTSGSFSFGVGEVVIQSETQPGGSGYPFPSAWEVAARWTNFAAQSLLMGGLLFSALVWRPFSKDARRLLDTDSSVTQRSLDRPVSILRASAVMVAIAALTLLLLQFNVAGASPWQGRLNLAFNYLTSSRLGQVLLFRIGLAIIATYFVWLIPRSNGNYLELHGPPVGFAATLLLTNSLVSHSAAVDYLPVLDIASDWLHQLAAAIWIGGLFHLVLSLSKIWNLRDDIRARLIALLIPRFSAVAIASVGVLAVTGFYSLWLQVGSVPSLFSTPYGITLIVKLLLAAPIVFLGGFNHFVVHGRLSKSIAGKLGSAATRLVSHFHRFVRIEAALGLIVLLAVGILTSLPPAVQQPPSADRDATPLILTNEAEGVRFTLRVSPAQIGSNTFEVTISDGNNDPITNAELVLVAFRYLERDMGEARARFNNVGKGEYALQGTYLSLPGRWQLEVLVRRPSAYDAIARFEFNVPELELEVLERPLLGSESSPYGIAIDTSGNVWFAESGAGKIGVLNPRTGEIKEFSLPDSSARPLWLTIDQGDTIWITDPQNNQVVNFDPITGISDGYEIPTVDAVPAAIAIDYNGDVWFTELIAGKIGRIDSTTQLIQEYLIPTPQSVPTGIAIGDNKTIWFTEAASGKIARLDTLTGEILEFEPTTFNLIAPTDITVAEDGSVWLTEHGGNRITKFDPNEGTFTPHALTSEQAWPWALAFDNLQRLWFVEHGANMIGTLDVETGIVKEFTITTPDSDAQLLAIDQSNNVWFTMPGSGKVGVITLSNSGLHIQSTPTRDSAFGAVLTSLGLAIGVVAVGVYAMNRRRFNKLRNAFDVVVQDR